MIFIVTNYKITDKRKYKRNKFDGYILRFIDLCYNFRIYTDEVHEKCLPCAKCLMYRIVIYIISDSEDY